MIATVHVSLVFRFYFYVQNEENIAPGYKAYPLKIMLVLELQL